MTELRCRSRLLFFGTTPTTASPPRLPMEPVHHDHMYCSSITTSLGAEEDMQVVAQDGDMSAEDKERTQKMIEDVAIRNKMVLLGRFAASDEDIHFYTRFASYAHLMAFWRQIEPEANKMKTRTRDTTDLSVSHTAKTLQPIEEFFLFLTFLSLGQMPRGQMSPSEESVMITRWANLLYVLLGSVCIWMSQESVLANLPDAFRSHWSTQVILGFIEVHCQRSDHCESSTNKPLSTYKGLVGVSPHGAVTFVSPLFCPSSRPIEVLRKSGIVPLLEPTSGVLMAGENVGCLREWLPCRVYAPTRKIRPHVDRLFRRVRGPKIFNTVVPFSLRGSVQQLYTVSCLLVNYQHGPLYYH